MAEHPPTLIYRTVFVPSLRVDRGMGHLKRCLAAASAAGGAVYFGADEELRGTYPIFDRAAVQGLAEAAGVKLFDAWPAGQTAATVVSDQQAVSARGYGFLRLRAQKLVGWDEGGPQRARFPYLVDSLPHNTLPPANVRRAGLLGLSFAEKPHTFDRPVRSVLAVFGGADPAQLTPRFLRFVEKLRSQGRWPYTLTIVRGPLSHFTVPPDTKVLDAPPRLSELVGQFDLVVTSWGLTALEALAAGTPILLLNPTPYHERLTRDAGLPSIGLRRPRQSAFLAGLKTTSETSRMAFATLLEPPLDAGKFFEDFRGTDGRCPVCRTAGHSVYFRTEHKSYHRCSDCGMEYLSVHQLPPKVYSEAYFFEDYQKQYGKTYLDDFDHIRSLGTQRLAFLERVAGPQKQKRILDVGCAYGPFLAAAAQAGHRPFGLDVAEGAVEHVRTRLGFPAVKASILEAEWAQLFPGEPLPDIVTLWYVIEHFADLSLLLTRVNRLLPVGGYFAFGTPNGKGITRLFSPEKFWTESPDDHFSIWNPGNTRAVLRRFGFEVLGVRITGHHPERFPGASPGLKRNLVSFLSKRLGWGDTFEIYARKTKELP